MKKGLDGRAQNNKTKQIREVNGAKKISNITPEYPEFGVFNQKLTLTDIKRQNHVSSFDQARKVARAKRRGSK
jgi:hypothetical protein